MDEEKLEMLRELVGVGKDQLSDEELTKMTKGTFMEAKVDLEISISALKSSILKEIEKDTIYIKKKIVGIFKNG